MQELQPDSRWKALTIKQWKAELTSLLLLSDKALDRAIIRIWEQQTYTEQDSGQALIVDGMGFNKFDAPLMNKYAQQLISTGHLSEYQHKKARNIMPKYWRQLMNLSKVQHGW